MLGWFESNKHELRYEIFHPTVAWSMVGRSSKHSCFWKVYETNMIHKCTRFERADVDQRNDMCLLVRASYIPGYDLSISYGYIVNNEQHIHTGVKESERERNRDRNRNVNNAWKKKCFQRNTMTFIQL